MTLPLSPGEWLLATLVIVVGATIQGSIGYGVALLGAPLLFLINPDFVPAPVIIIGLSLPVMILLRDWRAVEPRDVGWALPGSVAGVVVAGALLKTLPREAMGLVFGVLILFGVGLSVAGRMPRPGPPHLFGGAALSAFMGTTTSIGGPPLALVLQHTSGPRLRGTMSAIFVPAGLLSLAALAWAGRFGSRELLLGLSLLPGVVAGFLLSGPIAHLLDRHWLRPVILAISAVAALAAIIDAIVMLR